MNTVLQKNEVELVSLPDEFSHESKNVDVKKSPLETWIGAMDEEIGKQKSGTRIDTIVAMSGLEFARVRCWEIKDKELSGEITPAESKKTIFSIGNAIQVAQDTHDILDYYGCNPEIDKSGMIVSFADRNGKPSTVNVRTGEIKIDGADNIKHNIIMVKEALKRIGKTFKNEMSKDAEADNEVKLA